MSFVESQPVLLAIVAFPRSLVEDSYSVIEDLLNAGMRVIVWSRESADFVRSLCEKLRMTTGRIISGREWSKLTRDVKLSTVKESCVFCEFTGQEGDLVGVQSILNECSGVISNQAIPKNAHFSGSIGTGIRDLSSFYEMVRISMVAAARFRSIVVGLLFAGILEVAVVAGAFKFVNIDWLFCLDTVVVVGNFVAARRGL